MAASCDDGCAVQCCRSAMVALFSAIQSVPLVDGGVGAGAGVGSGSGSTSSSASIPVLLVY